MRFDITISPGWEFDPTTKSTNRNNNLSFLFKVVGNMDCKKAGLDWVDWGVLDPLL